MRLNDLNDGSIKTLLILALIIANLVVASFPQPKQIPSPPDRGRNVRTTKFESMTNDEAPQGRLSSFVIGSFLRPSSFGFRH
jgi:hypothetical protein